ncbi:hypothetical protein [Lacinutrix sp. MEBiC02595]
MTPLQYKSQYLHLRVLERLLQTTPDQDSQIRATTISISKYRSARNTTSTRTAASSRSAIESAINVMEKTRVIGLIRQTGNNGLDREAVSKCFHGKGSVADCQKTLTALVAVHATDHLQSYCDRYLGTDCSGFVNSYFSSVHGMPAKAIRFYFTRGRRNQRTSFNAFRNNDVLIWCDVYGNTNDANEKAEHIAIINTVRGISTNELQALVVESTGTFGLVHSYYTFFNTRIPEVYRICRPLKPGITNYVKVVPALLQ